MDAHGLVTMLDQLQCDRLLNDQLQQVLGALVGGYLVAEDAPDELKLADHLVAHATRENGHRGLVLRQQAADVPRVRDHDDYVDVQLLHAAHRRLCDSLRDAHRMRRVVSDVVEVSFVVVAALRLRADLAHDLDRLNGVSSVCGFARERDCVCAVEDCVGDIRGFGASGRWVVDHRLEHLERGDHGLGRNDGALN